MKNKDLLNVTELKNGSTYVTIRIDNNFGARRAMMLYAKELLEMYEVQLAGDLANLINKLGGTVDWGNEK